MTGIVQLPIREHILLEKVLVQSASIIDENGTRPLPEETNTIQYFVSWIEADGQTIMHSGQSYEAALIEARACVIDFQCPLRNQVTIGEVSHDRH